MLSLLLLKSCKVSKSEEDLSALERRIDIRKIGKIDELLIDDQTIQQHLNFTNTTKRIELAKY